MKMYDLVKYPQSSCACGKHDCADCANNIDGDPTHCLEWACYAGAICRFKERGGYNQK